MYDLRREKTKQREAEKPTTEGQRKTDPLAERKKRQSKQRRERKEKKEQEKSHAVIAHLPLFFCFARFYLLLFTHKHINIALYSYFGVCVVSSSSFSSFLLAAKNVIPHPRKKENREKSSLEIVLVWFGSTIDLFYSQIFFVWLFLIVAAAAAPSIDAAAAAAAFICCNGAGAAAPAAAAGACLFSAR